MNITEFLIQRIAEDEREAKVCLASPEHSTRRWVRVLAECAAKRAVVELHSQGGLQWVGFPRADRQEAYCVHDNHSSPCKTLCHLAAVYADHPEYLAGWAPDE